MKKLKNIWFALFLCGIIGSLAACNDSLSVEHAYDFSVTTLPVQKRISKGETAEIRCTLIREGIYSGTRYFIRYFQPDGKGVLRMDDGTQFSPNDLYPLTKETFRLYYTSLSDDQQVIDIYIVDNFGQSFTLSFSFTNE